MAYRTLSVVAGRALLLFFLAAGLLAGSPLQAADDPLAAVKTWIRLKGDLAGAVTYEWVRGTAFGVPREAQSLALFDIESVTARQTRVLPGGGYEERNFACRLYRDIESGAYIDSFRNPLTSGYVALNASCNDGFGIRYTAERVELTLDMGLQSSALGVPMQLQMIDMGEQTIVRHVAHSVFKPKGAIVQRRELSIDSFTVSTNAFRDETITNLPAVYSWTSRAEWMSILDMGEIPGHMLWTVQGRKFMRIEDLPADFRKALEQRVPGALSRRIDWSDFPARP